jgi:aryl-alcohol dehydrogenase-like predicted oxidoreductase
MRQRALADTVVTAVGVGDVRLTTADARGVDAREVERALHHALELGITLVEASEEPEAERLCGDTVRSLRLRDRVVVATRIPAAPRPPPGRVLQARIEASLRATRLEALPLAQLPIRIGWSSDPVWPELVGTCARLTREGKVLRWAAALEVDADREQLDGELGEPFVAVALRLSACDRAGEPQLARSLPVLARSPLAGGTLAGELGPGVKLAPRDDRRALDERMLERIAIGCARLAPLVREEPPAVRSCDAARAVREQARRPEEVPAASLAELALRYVIDRGALALPRLHRPGHVATAIAAASAPPLPGDAHARIEGALAVTADPAASGSA